MRTSLAAIAILSMVSAASAEVELKNDGFASGGQAVAQGGFVAGEIGAARFIAPEAGRQLLKVQLIYAGAPASRTITLKAWDDSAGTNAPGAELYTGDFQLTGSDSALQEIATTDMTVILPMQFRVGIVFGDGCPTPPSPCGVPSITRDNDGNVDAAKNYIFAIPGGWVRSSMFFNGDWIIRAFVTDGGVAPVDGAPDAGATGGDDCAGNADCPVGQFCDNNACTFECREDPDCGDGTCNSLGQCVGGGGGGGGGCCQTDRGNGAGALLLGLLVGLVTLVRRRA